MEDDVQRFSLSGQVHLPKSWRVLNIESTKVGSIIWVERKSIFERVVDWLEEFARRHF